MYEQQEMPTNNFMAVTKKGTIKFQLKLADQLRHFYNPKTKCFQQQLNAQYIKQATVFEKQLDQPLGWIKKTFAFFARIKTKHEFLVFQLQSGISGSIDFYLENRVVLRLGNSLTVSQLNQKRKDAVIVSKHHKPYKINLQKIQNGVTFGDLVQIIHEITPQNGYSQIKYNGSHFSNDIMRQLRKQKKGKGSIIRSKIFQDVKGFDLI